MKIRVEIDDSIAEDEVVIRCSDFTDEHMKLKQTISQLVGSHEQLAFYKGETQYYIALGEILFFETENGQMCAHTANDVFTVKLKLYELEELLPSYFVRVSKSSILNSRKIYSITKNITASSMVEFQNSHKKVYVSRYYYKILKDMLGVYNCKR